MRKKITAIILVLVSLLWNANMSFAEVQPPELLTGGDSSLQLWVKGDKGLEDIDGALKWRDYSGKNNHMTANKNIPFKKRAVNQRGALEFTESGGQYLEVTYPTPYIGDATIFLVVNIKHNGYYKAIFSTYSTETFKAQNTIAAHTMASQHIEGGSWTGPGGDAGKDGFWWNYPWGNYKVLTMRLTEQYVENVWSDTRIETFYGGTSNRSGTWNGRAKTNYRFNTHTGFMIGHRDGNGDTPDMEVAEAIVFFRALSDAEIDQVNAYLYDKYFVLRPPEDGIEFQLVADSEVFGNETELYITSVKVPGSIYDQPYKIVVQTYLDKELTIPVSTLTADANTVFPFIYNKNYYAKVMAVSKYPSEPDNIGKILSHPIIIPPKGEQ